MVRRDRSIAVWAIGMSLLLAVPMSLSAAPAQTRQLRGPAVPAAPVVGAPSNKTEPDDPDAGKGYMIEKPGTITFTVGVKIKGKVEKPQVMIFLPKERPQYRESVFRHSFKSDLMEPLPFKPNLE